MSNTPPEAAIDLNIRNGCMINAIAYQDILKSYDGSQAVEAHKTLSKNSDRWTRIMVVEYNQDNQTKDHALCWFEFNNQTWVYDSMFGTWRVFNDFIVSRDPMELAVAWRPSYDVKSAFYIDDNGSTIPVAPSSNSSFLSASFVDTLI